MYDETTINGITYITDSALTCGDYGGAGSVGVANLRSLEAMADESGSTGLDQDEEIDQMHTTYAHFERMRKGWAWEGDYEIDAPLVFLSGAYGSRTAWVRADHEELAEVVNALSDYPLIDDEECSKVEMEWEDEAWDSWIRSELLRSIEDDLTDKIDALEAQGKDLDSLLYQAYRDAMERENEYPTPEHYGVHVAVDRIADTFADMVTTALEQSRL
jgi:hypothetical protein